MFSIITFCPKVELTQQSKSFISSCVIFMMILFPFGPQPGSLGFTLLKALAQESTDSVEAQSEQIPEAVETASGSTTVAKYACKDPLASNYDDDSTRTSKDSLCEHEESIPETVATTQTAAAANMCSAFNFGYRKLGDEDFVVAEIQAFLNTFEEENLPVTGRFGIQTKLAVERFQEKYRADILDPWGLSNPTGWWYQSTEHKARVIIGCDNIRTELDNGVVLVNNEILNAQQTAELLTSLLARLEALQAQLKALQNQVVTDETTQTETDPAVLADYESIANAETVPKEQYCQAFRAGHRELGDQDLTVAIIQRFLNDYENAGLPVPVTGKFGLLTQSAVEGFQEKYRSDVLTPWGLSRPSGWWYQATEHKARTIVGCDVPDTRLDNGVILQGL